MSNRYKGTGRTALSITLTLIITASMVLIMTALTILTGLGNRDALRSQINRSTYFDDVMKKMNSYIETTADEHNVPTDIFEGIITARQINLDSGRYMSAAFENEKADINTDKINKQLWQRIDEYIRVQNISMTDELKTSMNEWLNTIIRNYKSSAGFTFVEEYSQIRSTYISKIYIVMTASIAAIVISGVILTLLYRRKYISISYILDGTVAASLIQIMTTYIMSRMVKLPEDYSNNDVYKSIINNFIKSGIVQGYYMVSIGVVVSVIMIVLIQYFRRKGDHRHG